jgi:hypothetical protein
MTISESKLLNTCLVQCRITALEKAAFQAVIDKQLPESGRPYTQSKILRGLIRHYITCSSKVKP